MPEHATGSRAAKGNLVSRIDAQLPKRLTPEADLYVDAADGGPHATPDRAAIGPKPWRCELCGHTKGLVWSKGRIECFTIPACEARRNGTPHEIAAWNDRV